MGYDQFFSKKHTKVYLAKFDGEFLLLKLYREFEKMYPGLISNSEDNFYRKYKNNTIFN